MSKREQVDPKNLVLSGVIVCVEGPAKGKDFDLTAEFCHQLAKLGNEAGEVKARINHPEGRGNVLSIVGKCKNFIVEVVDEVTRTICDIQLLPGEDSQKLVTLAQEAPNLFGMSIDAIISFAKKAVKGRKQAVCEQLNAVDFVDTPAATPALFSENDGQMHLSIPASVDFKSNNAQSNDLRSKNMARTKLEDEPKKTEAEATEEPKKERDLAAELDAMAKRLEGLEASCKKLEAAAEPKEPHKEPDGDEEVKEEASDKPKHGFSASMEKAVNDAAARAVTAMLSKTGLNAKPSISEPKVDDEPKDEVQLTDDQRAIATKLGIDPKAYAANLNKERARITL